MTQPLDSTQLRRRVAPESFPFETTEDLPPLRKPLGQQRALKALEFGLEMKSHGYNIFVLGPPGAGKRSTTMAVLDAVAKKHPAPNDKMYVFNFTDEEHPLALSLPAGEGEVFRQDMELLVQSLSTEIPKAFAGEGFEKEKSTLARHANEAKTEILKRLENVANQHGFLVQRSADGLALVYARDGSPLNQDDFDKLEAAEQQQVRDSRKLLHEKLRNTLEQLRAIDEEARQSYQQLEQRVAIAAVGHGFDALLGKYANYAGVIEYLQSLQRDVLQNLDEFRRTGNDMPGLPFPFRAPTSEDRTRKYRVNLLVNNKDQAHAPVLYESNPTYHNLIGRIEHHAQMGGFVTDFTLIKAGAFHRADGGYLLLNARDLLINPFAYDALKRVLKDQEVRMEEIGEQFRLISTATLKPEPIRVRVKVILLGTPWLYYLLQHFDEDFSKLFKVKGDFADDMELNDDNRMSYAFLIATHCAEEGLLPFHRDAVARVVEHGLREASHQARLSTHFLDVTDLVREAHYWAKRDHAPAVRSEHVRKAADEKIYRNNYLEELIGRSIADGTLHVEVTGRETGQVNGLSVYDLGDYSFGKPSRVSAKVFFGKEGLINIERESELGGPLHNKGVLILQGYFGSKYARRFPISFAATVCFEQSYGGVEGDSASSTELFALISAIAELPVRQDLAVTGSVDQLGRIQAVGGINQKIEGFFQTCEAKGLSGSQGVIIPGDNVPHLMLSDAVVEAVEAKRFHIYPITTVDEGLSLLTGLPAGEDDGYGNYPVESVNGKVLKKLERMFAQWKRIHSEE